MILRVGVLSLQREITRFGFYSSLSIPQRVEQVI